MYLTLETLSMLDGTSVFGIDEGLPLEFQWNSRMKLKIILPRIGKILDICQDFIVLMITLG